MNQSKKNNPFYWLKLMASGAVKTAGKDALYDQVRAAAARQLLAGGYDMAVAARYVQSSTRLSFYDFRDDNTVEFRVPDDMTVDELARIEIAFTEHKGGPHIASLARRLSYANRDQNPRGERSWLMK